jgi:hypothetical protein
MLIQYNNPLVLTHLQLLGKVFEYGITAKAAVVGSISTPGSIIMTTRFELFIKASWLAIPVHGRPLIIEYVCPMGLGFSILRDCGIDKPHSPIDNEDVRSGHKNLELYQVRSLASLANSSHTSILLNLEHKSRTPVFPLITLLVHPKHTLRHQIINSCLCSCSRPPQVQHQH